MEKKIGRFYGVGVGPGDPELITLKALNILKRVPVVFAPVSRYGKPSYALAIAGKFLDPSRQKTVELLFPMTRDKKELARHHDRAAETILNILEKGTNAAFITEGDPFIYSTFIYLFERLSRMVPAENIRVVPGVTSFCAAAAVAGFPIVDGGGRLAVIPSVYDTDLLKEALERFDSVVFMKVKGVLPELMSRLKRLGLENNFVYVERCGTRMEKIIRDPEELVGIESGYLSLVIVTGMRLI